MVPQNFKDLLSSEDGTGFYQTLALLLFMIFFVGIIVYTFSRSKKHYHDAAHTPLEEDEQNQKFTL